ncbi:Uncharacterized protein TPAR_05747 [Tolypocladium paradoxum]|uniref:Cysteine-rich PDZ-binding protein n=1 Tax=Tolypocladium paradoxum TaxID=94208 RepID=A0A2S4KV45_9HYPO|nr:Uncharacterized protein TPAR_05747 [Tolypocladium paradoxum]
MVCAKCQKLIKGTTLATPEVKKKSEMYYGSSASSSSKGSGAKSTTLGHNGIGKARNRGSLQPQQASVQIGKEPICSVLKSLTLIRSSCTKCKTKITQGHSFCHTCAYKDDVCAMCGKPNKKSSSKAPVVSGQKFSLK